MTCKYTIQWPMRAADKAVCAMTAGPLRGPDCVHRLVKASCEYVWDHLAGEPEDVTPEQLYEHIAPLLKEWFSKTDQAARSSTE